MIHTFELITPSMNYAAYSKIESRVYDYIKQGTCQIARRNERSLFFTLPHDPGVRICLHNATVPYAVFIVNPSVMLGGGYADLYRLSSKRLATCLTRLSFIMEKLDLGFSAKQLILSRIDCTTDVKFPRGIALDEFLSCVRRTKLPHGYHIERFPTFIPDHKELNRRSFRMNCKDISLTIYDKSFQLENEGLTGETDTSYQLLRFEAAFHNSAFQRLLLKYEGDFPSVPVAGENTTETLILWFSNLSLRLLQDYFGTHMTPGQYLRGDLALQRIDAGPFSEKVRERMKVLLYEVSRCHQGGLEKALEVLETSGLSQNELQYLLKCFQIINLNPAAIRGSTGYQMFPSILDLLR